MNKQIFIAVKDTNMLVKLVDHKDDPETLVIKTKHPELGSILAVAACSTINQVEKGSCYYLTFVPKKAFFAGLGVALFEIQSGNLNVSSVKSFPIIADLSDVKDPEDEDDEDEEEDSDEDEE